MGCWELEIPESIEKLTKLKNLELISAKTILPKTIGNLSNLEILGLRGAKIAEIPESITKLAQLKKIVLSDSEIEKLPEGINPTCKLSVSWREVEGFRQRFPNHTFRLE